jgi:hypothetical protein
MLVPQTNKLFLDSLEIAADDCHAETFSILRFERLFIFVGVYTFFISLTFLLEARPS